MKNLQKFWVIVLMAGAILVTIAYQLSEILWPFIFAFIFAYLLYPFVKQLKKAGIRKSPAVWGVFLIFSLLFLTLGAFLVSMIRAEIPAVQEKIPVYADTLQKNGIPYLEKILHLKLQKTTQDYIKGFTERLLALSPGMAESISNFAAQVFSKTLNFLLFFIDLLLIPVVLLYLLFDFDKIRLWIPRLVPEVYQRRFKEHLGEIDQILRQFIGGQLLISAVLGVLYMIGLTWIGLDLSIILGFFSALMNIIPFIGVLTGAFISTLFALFKFHDAVHPLLVIGLYTAGHLLDGYYLNPKIVGHRIGLHPLLMILVLLTGGKLFGVMGLLFSVPVAAVGNYLLKAGFNAYMKSNFYTGKSSVP
ncbi:MAG: AI-2E family transporter [Nitrospirae bacterium]|nr:AI-2E family transporter [Nitrospirota bacterium]MBI3352983.1 AI-2E family transporter [Nitrospirota bacterium]